MIITLDGQDYEITNWEEFQKQLLTLIGAEVEASIVKEIQKQDLISPGGSAEFFQSIRFDVSGDTLTIYSDVPYAGYLEYGTMNYNTYYSPDSFPTVPHRKKTRPTKMSKTTHAQYPKGMQPFAPFRRILYNQKKMNVVIKNAMSKVTA